MTDDHGQMSAATAPDARVPGQPAAPHRLLMVGCGGFATAWLDRFLPAFRDRVTVVGLVDVDRATLDRAGDRLGVPAGRRYTAMAEGFAATDANCCVIVVQPMHRREAVALATARGLAILAEKPIADSWKASLDILGMVRATGTKMAVTQNYRYAPAIRTMKRVLDDGELGRVNYIACRFTIDFTIDTAGGAFRHQIPHAMLYEGLVHHFDQFRNLAGADGESVAGYSWNPPWTTFANDTTAAFVLRMTNGVVGQFEVNHLARGTQNGWHQEGYRVECEHGAVTVDADERVRTYVHLGGNRLQVTDVAPVVAPYADHDEVIRQFLDWLDGGPAPETAIEDNIHTAALSFAAVEAVRTGTTVDVRALTRDGLDHVTPSAGSRGGGAPCP